jgi:hypothetical protein
MAKSNLPRSHLELRPLLRTLAILALGFSAIAAKPETSPQDILQHFYRATGGRAWQRFEGCDSAGRVAFLQKTGTVRYIENLHTGGNRADIEISALEIKQANGNDLMQSWEQNAAGDIQLSPPDDPVSIDDRYLTSRGYWRPEFGGAVVTCLPRKRKAPSHGTSCSSRFPVERVLLSGSIAKPAC